jgi:vacuolar-type H+-ATPase catalytic subunit A/Vma1
MDVKRDLNRLGYMISNQNKPNQNDADALNNIIDYVEQERKRQFTNNQLLAKLFINDMLNDTIGNEGDYQKSYDVLRSVFRIDLQEHLNNFNSHMNQLFLENQLKETKDIDKIVFTKWTREQTQDRVMELINNCLDDYQ